MSQLKSDTGSINICATRLANKFSLGKLRNSAIHTQSMKIALKPFQNDFFSLCPFHAAKAKAMGVMTHHGKKNCAIKERNSMRMNNMMQ
jgi:hypothetical protein